MKIIEIINARNVIESIFTEKISSRLAYKFTKFLKETDVEEDFYKKRLRDIMKKYGETDEHGNYIIINNNIKIKDTYRDTCMSDVEELDNTDVEMPNIVFNIDEFEDIKLSIEKMCSLFAFIKEK